MISSNNPISFQPSLKTTRILVAVTVGTLFPALLNSLIVTNSLAAIINFLFDVTRVWTTFAASTLSGTATATQDSDTIIGDGTDFLNELVVGDVVTIAGEQLEVTSITSATVFTVATTFKGTTAANLIITKSPRPTQIVQVIITVDGTDVSNKIINTVSVDWPDDAGGFSSLTLIDSNPFAAGALIDIEKPVNISATFTDANNQVFSVQLFKGFIVQFDYDTDTDELRVDVQDVSRSISKETDKINQEIHGVDPVLAETITAPANDKLVTSKSINMDTDNPIFGIWLEGDNTKSNNIAEQVDFLIGADNKTITVVAPLGKITAGVNYTIRYALLESEFVRSVRTKSEVVQDIAILAGVATLINTRTGKIEDEIVEVNIVANQELPLDIIRKIVLPQTWKVEFSESGDLIIRRDQLKVTPDFIFNESSVIEQSLTLTKALDSVINEQTISGIAKRLGRT